MEFYVLCPHRLSPGTSASSNRHVGPGGDSTLAVIVWCDRVYLVFNLPVTLKWISRRKWMDGGYSVRPALKCNAFHF